MKKALSMCLALGCAVGLAALTHCGGPTTQNNGNPDASTDGSVLMPDGGHPPDGGSSADAGDGGSMMAVDAGANAAAALALVNQVANAMRKFHHDTGGWPQGNSAWYGVEPAWELNDAGTPLIDSTEIAPGKYQTTDVSLFSAAAYPDSLRNKMNLPTCASESSQPCWGGPYLDFAGTPLAGAVSLADVTDPWGNPLLFTYIRPFDGNGGGSLSQPNGAVVIWSMGNDKADQTGCTIMANCLYDEDKVVTGRASVDNADDIIILVTSDTTTTTDHGTLDGGT